MWKNVMKPGKAMRDNLLHIYDLQWLSKHNSAKWSTDVVE
jgi:hypothetical protein